MSAPQLIAVIDDDPMMRRGLEGLLSAYGYLVELYDSAEAFMQHARTCRAMCLLVDIQLGSCSGFDLARRLAAAGFAFPIIFMTGNDDSAMAQRALEVGGLGCLRKPFSTKLLMDLVIKSKRGHAAR